MDNLTTPLINLNGNSKEQINEQNLNVYRSLSATIQAMSKTEYDNGRNSIDKSHHLKMREEKAEIIQGLKKYQNLFMKLQVEINKK
jgi:hypothetical protein